MQFKRVRCGIVTSVRTALIVIALVGAGVVVAPAQEAEATVVGAPFHIVTQAYNGPRPFDIEIDPATAWWHVPNIEAGGVTVVDAAGRIVDDYGSGVLGTIIHIAISGNRTYVTTLDNRVEYFQTSSGVHLGGWGSAGAGNGQFQTPWGIDVAGAEVFVADIGNDRVQVFTLDGTHLRTIDGAGTIRPMAEISGLFVHDGLLYIAESASDDVVVYDAVSGALVRFFGTGMSFISDIEITTADDVFVSGEDSSNEEMAVFDPFGIEQTRFDLSGDPEGFAVDPSGESIWFADEITLLGPTTPAMSIYTYVRCNSVLPNMVGTSYADTIDLTGWPFEVRLWLGSQADTAILTEGDDVACGGPGADTISGLGGIDAILGGSGPDVIRGGPGIDDLRGEGGADELRAGGGNDQVSGGPGADTLFGQGGSDLMSGGPGADTMHGQGAADILIGGDGDDDLNGQNGADEIMGDGDNDVIRSHTGPDVIEGGDGDDQLFAGNGADELFGGAGTDKCAGNLGPDRAQAATCEQTPGVETLF